MNFLDLLLRRKVFPEHEHKFTFSHWDNHPIQGLQIVEKCDCGETRSTLDDDDDPITIFFKMNHHMITAQDFYALMTRVNNIEKRLEKLSV